jgi:hypothetical protein
MEIRHGRMFREEAIELIEKYDHVRPSTLETYINFLGINEATFYEWIEPMRDEDIWERDSKGQWQTKDNIANHKYDPGIDKARNETVAPDDRTFGKNNYGFYWKEGLIKSEQLIHDSRTFKSDDKSFIVL